MIKKILFLHGFFASGDCELALTLKESFAEKAEVLAPDLPLFPKKAMAMIRDIIDKEKPDLLIGNSCGAFYAQMLAPIVGVPALLGNPHFRMSDFIRQRIGEHQYKSPRKDGKQRFAIMEPLITEFAELEATQFDCCNPYYRERVWGLFGEQDTLAEFEPMFREHYDHSFHFPGGHTPTADEVVAYYVPLAEEMLDKYPKPADGNRYFRHFKGGLYRYAGTAFHSETTERMVVYEALYGYRHLWVRPEKMFFETVSRDGQTFPRFTEIDNPNDNPQ